MFSVVHEHRLQEYSTWHAYQTLLKIIHRYKTTIKYKIKIINSLLCWSVTLLMFIQTSNSSHCKFGACQKWEPAGRIGDFGNFFSTVSLKAHACLDRPKFWINIICIAKLWNATFCPRSVWWKLRHIVLFHLRCDV